MSDSMPSGHDHTSSEFGAVEPLSPAGRTRRETMLPVLQGAVVRTGRRRAVRRFAARSVATLVVVFAAGVAFVELSRVPTGDRPPGRMVGAPSLRHKILHSRPGALQRCALNAHVDASRLAVDDAEFVEVLDLIGRPAGIIRSGGRIWLTEPVTDDELAPPAAKSPTKAGEGTVPELPTTTAPHAR